MNKPAWLTKLKVSCRLLINSVVLLLVIGAIVWYRNTLFPGGIGFGGDVTVVTSEEKDSTGNTKTITTTTPQLGKTLWDWLSVLGFPFSLAVLGFWFQQLQQKQAVEQTELEREITENNQREEALQAYFDRLSELLVDKNLIAIAAERKDVTTEEKELLHAAVDVIRARTLAILVRFSEDVRRKTSTIQFLAEAEVVSKLKLDLSFAELDCVSLSGAKLSGAKLLKANLSNANLSGARLSGANLSGARLSNANLSGADLSGADLSGANLSGANLSTDKLSINPIFYDDFNGTNLSNANLSGANLSNANLSGANLSNTNLSGANLSNTNLSGATFSHIELDALSFDRFDRAMLSSSDADRSNAFLSRANLSSTDLSGAKNWTEEQLSSAKLCETKLPEGCSLDPNRDCQELNANAPQP